MAPIRLLTILLVVIALHAAVCSAAAQPKVIVIGAGTALRHLLFCTNHLTMKTCGGAYRTFDVSFAGNFSRTFVAFSFTCILCSMQILVWLWFRLAGMSGVSAARTLADSGAAVTVLEGRTRIGGRTWSDRTLGFANDMGASWVRIKHDRAAFFFVTFFISWSSSRLIFCRTHASQIHGPIPFVSGSWTASGPPVAAPTSYASLQAAAATAGWTYKDNPTFDPSVTPKPWNPITQLAYKAGVPLIRT